MERGEKKKRTSNFTEAEKMLLVDLINEKKHIIENKVTNSGTLQEKEKCWEDITDKFNSASTFAHRDVQTLRNCWDNIKKRTRKHFAEEKKGVYKTGGGPCHLEENPLANKTREIIRSSVDGMSNDVDDDCVSTINERNIPPSANTTIQNVEMGESAMSNLLDDSNEYEIECIPEYEEIYSRLGEKKTDLATNTWKRTVSKGDEALPSTSTDGNATIVEGTPNRSKQQSGKKFNRFYNTTVSQTTRETSKQKIAQFTKLAESKIALSETLVKNEEERHSIEMAIAKQKLIREKLEVEVLQTELEIKKAILIREKSKNVMLGVLTDTE